MAEDKLESAFIDTNVFLRFLLEDVATQQAFAKKVFEDGALGKVGLKSSVIVFFEIYWVLKSSCDMGGLGLAAKLEQILRLAVRFENHELLSKSVKSMNKFGFDLEDSYNANYSKAIGIKNFITFDKKLSNTIRK